MSLSSVIVGLCIGVFLFFEALGNFLETILSAVAKQALLQFLVCALACANCKCAYACAMAKLSYI